ncbi:hypothetical protein M5K25_001990 [Dendrobium thyrsiflorum]|uniref:Uncharacterized protein n=1 Tax=Dendrobium thyrsiflorum TaxID=117978 RepID=A0ABD0VS96_DENTH
MLIDYIQNLTPIRSPSTRRKQNIALGHGIGYILKMKYEITYPAPPDNIHIFYTDAFFRILFHHPWGQEQEEPGFDEEGGATPTVAPPPEPAPVPPPAPAYHSYPHEDIIQRLDRLGTCLDSHLQQQ